MAAEPVEFEVDGLTVAGYHTAARGASDAPLIVALHGGLYTAGYFDVDGSGNGSFLDLAAAHGHPVLTVDRPGYGASSRIPAPENTFVRQAEILASVAAQGLERLGASKLFLVGHSIGGMIAVTLAANDRRLPLIGISVTGMGAVIPVGQTADGLAAAAVTELVKPPAEQADAVMFGPAWTFAPEVLPKAHATYAEAPAEELIAAPQWPREHLEALAPRVLAPVHNAVAEFDALWDSSSSSVSRFASLFTAAPGVDASVARATGHSIDHHLLGGALHLRQLAFAAECALAEARPWPSGGPRLAGSRSRGLR